MKIFDILPVGEENAISAKALSAKLGLSVRECRARISKELQEGSFCLSSTHRPGGYFRPSPGEKGRQELLRFYRRELSRSRSSARKLKTVRTALEECEGQETAFDIDTLERPLYLLIYFCQWMAIYSISGSK